MSQYIHDLKVGATLDVRGPTGRLVSKPFYGKLWNVFLQIFLAVILQSR